MAEPFSFSLVDSYRVYPRPRWGHGAPAHPKIAAVLARGRAGYEAVLREIGAHGAALHAIAHAADPATPAAPFWDNPWFSTLDAAALFGLLRARKPARYLEIGSGHSTMFAAHAVRAGGLSTDILSIDPNPRAEIDALCQRVLRAPLEMAALDLFDELHAGDILFFDGSHRVFQNSDVTAFFLDVLPRLKPGVLVHIHDIFLPDDYPPAWQSFLFSEQYLLAAMLLCERPPFRVLLPNYFVCADEALVAQVRVLFAAPTGGRDIPFTYTNPGNTAACSFWIETI